MQASEIKMLLNLPLIILVLTIKILHNVKTQIMLMLFLEQARRQWCSQPENFFEPIILTFSKQQYFVWDNTSQSAKQEMLENWWPCLWLRLCLWTTCLVPAGDLVPVGTTLVTPDF